MQAKVPGRDHPCIVESNYRNVVAAIADTKQEGYVGMEYRPPSIR
jgi:hydroxypyruvate isomerase